MKIRDKAIQLIKQGKVSQISDRMYQVKEYVVSFMKRQGRTLPSCGCENHSIYAGKTICSHKYAVIIYDFLKNAKPSDVFEMMEVINKSSFNT